MHAVAARWFSRSPLDRPGVAGGVSGVVHGDSIPYCVQFAPSETGGRLLAVGEEEGTVRLIDVGQLRRGDERSSVLSPVIQWAAHGNAVYDIAWRGLDSQVLTCSGDMSVKLWSVEQPWAPQRTFSRHLGSVKCLAVHPTADALFLSAGRDGNVCLWDVRLPQSVPAVMLHDVHAPPASLPKAGVEYTSTLQAGATEHVGDCQAIPSAFLPSALSRGFLTEAHPAPTTSTPPSVVDVETPADDPHQPTKRKNNVPDIGRRTRRKSTPTLPNAKRGTAHTVTDLHFLNDGVTFLTAGSVDGAVKAFDLRSLHLPAPPRSTSQRRTPSGGPVGPSRPARGRATTAKPLLELVPSPARRGVTALALDPAQGTLACNLIDETVVLYSLPRLLCRGRGPLQPATVLRGHTVARSFFVKLAFSPDGRSLVSGSADRRACVWHLPPRCGGWAALGPHRQLMPHHLIGHDGEVGAVAWNPYQDHQLATAADDELVRVWSLYVPSHQQLEPHRQGKSSAQLVLDGGVAELPSSLASLPPSLDSDVDDADEDWPATPLRSAASSAPSTPTPTPTLGRLLPCVLFPADATSPLAAANTPRMPLAPLPIPVPPTPPSPIPSPSMRTDAFSSPPAPFSLPGRRPLKQTSLGLFLHPKDKDTAGSA
eukprot:EG_transcript_3490